MSATCVDAGEAVSRPCLRAEAARSYPPAPHLPGQALFPWGYVEGQNDARTKRADSFTMLLGETRTAGVEMRKKADICRCPWVDLTKPDYVVYHDTEWGVPVHDDQRLFEFLTLEGAQAGLSWYTVLRKRDNYRLAFDHFDPEEVARYDEHKVQELLGNAGIIRNKAKIYAAINNARKFLDIQETFGSFDAYIWKFVDGRPIVHTLKQLKDYPATTQESDAMSKDLRQRGFTFVGSTVCYAHMQATGMVNDHTMTCVRRQEILKGCSSLPQRAKSPLK